MIKLNKSAKYPYVFINGTLSPTIIRALELETSFVVQNVDIVLKKMAEKAEKENKKPKPWDGRIRLMAQSKNGTYYVPIGLLPRVKKILKWFGVECEESLQFIESDEKLNLKWCGHELRTYQVDAFIEAMTAERCIINLPTGAGKTLIGTRIIPAIDKPTLILVHRRELMQQWKEAIKNNTGIDATAFDDKNKSFGSVTIAMVQSLHNYLKKESLPIFDVLILDEAHHVPADTFYQVALKCDARYRIGLTATTEREDGSDLYMEAGLGQICISVSAEDLVAQQHLALPVFEFIDVPGTSYTKYAKFQDEYKFGIVLNDTRNRAIAARAKQLIKDGRQVYIHVEQIAHGKLLSELIQIPFVYSKTKERDEIIDRFRKGEEPAIVSTLLGEGVDIPNIGAIIMAGGRKTKIGTIQKVGRALRPGKEKDAIIVDFIDKGRHLSKHTHERYDAYCEFYGDYVKKFKRR